MLSLLTLGFAGLALFIVQLVFTALTCPTRSLPGPWYSKFTHLILKYHIITGRRMYYVDSLHHKYGSLVRIAPLEVAVSDVEATQAIHKIGSGFTKSAWYEALTQPSRPGAEPNIGIFIMRDPKQHAARRKLFARPFSNSSLLANWEGVVREKVEVAISKIREECEKSGQADVLRWWTLMTTDVIAHLSFGEDFNSLEQGRQTPFIDALQATLMSSVVLSEFPPLRWLGPYIPLKVVQNLFESDKVVFAHAGLAFRNMRNSASNTQNLFGQMLAQADNQEKSDLTDTMVRQEAANLIVAGSDTTAITLTYIIWAVLKQPNLRDALTEEVGALSEDLTQDELSNATLLNSVIDEALRLYGAAPGALPRDVPPSGTTLCNQYIPGGVVVSTQAYTLHRNPDAFANPLEFDGRRFVKQPMTAQQKAAFMPFGAGTRTCLGIHLATMELRLAVAKFFREFHGVKLGQSMTDETMKMVEHFLIAPKGHCCNIVIPSKTM